MVYKLGISTKDLYNNYKHSVRNLDVVGFSWDNLDLIMELKHRDIDTDMTMNMKFKYGLIKSRKAVKTQTISDFNKVTTKQIKEILVNLEILVIIDMEWLDYMIRIKFQLIKPVDGITNIMLEFDHDILKQTEVGSYDNDLDAMMNVLNDKFLDELLQKHSMEELLKKSVDEIKEMFGEFLDTTADKLENMQED